MDHKFSHSESRRKSPRRKYCEKGDSHHSGRLRDESPVYGRKQQSYSDPPLLQANRKGKRAYPYPCNEPVRGSHFDRHHSISAENEECGGHRRRRAHSPSVYKNVFQKSSNQFPIADEHNDFDEYEGMASLRDYRNERPNNYTKKHRSGSPSCVPYPLRPPPPNSSFDCHEKSSFPKADVSQMVLPKRQFPLYEHLEVTFDDIITEPKGFVDEVAAEILKLVLSMRNRPSGEQLNAKISQKLNLDFVGVEDLKLFLKKYDNVFFIDTDRSDTVEEEVSRKSYVVTGKTDTELCQIPAYRKPGHGNKCQNCDRLHVCKFWLLSDTCDRPDCYFGHYFGSPTNMGVLRKHLLHRINAKDLCTVFRGAKSRNSTTVPRICLKRECGNGDDCYDLHICRYFAFGQCKFQNCIRSHTLSTGQSKRVLQLYGLDRHVEEGYIWEILRKFNTPPNQMITNCKFPIISVPASKSLTASFTRPTKTETRSQCESNENPWSWNIEGSPEEMDKSIAAEIENKFQNSLHAKSCETYILVKDKIMKIDFETMKGFYLGEEEVLNVIRNKYGET